MITITLYYCRICPKWCGTDKSCKVCNNETEPREVPKRRGGLYYLPQFDEPLPSVTDILKAIAKPQLIYWAAKTAATAALADPTLSVEQACAKLYEKRDAAGDRGRNVHTIIELIEKGKADYPTDPNGYITAYKKFKAEVQYEILHTEMICYSTKYKFAGQVDEIVKLKDGRICILDWKTSSGVYPDYGVQLAAYKQACNEMEIAIEGMIVVHLKENGTYSLIEMDEPFEVFLAAKRIHEWMK